LSSGKNCTLAWYKIGWFWQIWSHIPYSYIEISKILLYFQSKISEKYGALQVAMGLLLLVHQKYWAK